MVAKIQLLVHAGAASSFQHDDKYRSQAETYSHFKGRKLRARETHENAFITNGIPPVDETTTAHQATATMTSMKDQTTFLDDTQSAFLALESQLFPSAFPAPPPKSSLKRPAPVAFDDGEPAASRSAISQNTESHSHDTRSSYLKSPLLGRSPKKQRSDPGGIKRPPLPSANPVLINDHSILSTANQKAISIGNGNIPPPAAVSGVHEQNDTTSELPSSYSLSNVTSGSSRRPVFPSQRSTSDPGPVLSSSPVLSSGPKASSQLLHAEQSPKQIQAKDHLFRPDEMDGQKSPMENNRHTKISDSIAELPTVQKPEVDTNAALRLALNDLPLHIRPPESTVTLEPFKTHVTKKLRFLAEESEIANHYQPITVSRDIRPSERGCWMIRLSSLPLQLQIDFWRSLQRMIGTEAIAGWGVWASRETTDDSSLGAIKMFCWGEIVKHIYLLLFVASLSKVRKLGLQWIDAEGNVVVQMRG